jgi:hypothetical protein
MSIFALGTMGLLECLLTGGKGHRCACIGVAIYDSGRFSLKFPLSLRCCACRMRC